MVFRYLYGYFLVGRKERISTLYMKIIMGLKLKRKKNKKIPSYYKSRYIAVN